MDCPVCGQAVRESALECDCGESLPSWRTSTWSTAAMRHRGLTLAANEDYVGAALSFLLAAATDPLGGANLVDAARAAFWLGRGDDALRLLTAAGTPQAMAVAKAMQAVLSECASQEKAEGEGRFHAGPEAPASDAVSPKPLLALGPLKRSARWGWGKPHPKANDPLWARLLDLEQRQHDCRTFCPGLEPVVRGLTGQAALHYLMGLGHWQADDRDKARRAFTLCFRENPPTLNAAAYALYLNLNDLPRARRLLDEIGQACSPRDLEGCLDGLERRLADWGDHDRLDACGALRNGD